MMIQQEKLRKLNRLYRICKHQLNWIMCQVVISFAPLCVVYILARLLQYEPDLEQIFPDYLLAAFAVGFNLINNEIRKSKEVCEIIRDIYNFATYTITIITALIYVGLFGDNYVSRKVQKLQANYTHLCMIGILILLGISVAIVVISNGKAEYREKEIS